MAPTWDAPVLLRQTISNRFTKWAEEGLYLWSSSISDVSHTTWHCRGFSSGRAWLRTVIGRPRFTWIRTCVAIFVGFIGICCQSGFSMFSFFPWKIVVVFGLFRFFVKDVCLVSNSLVVSNCFGRVVFCHSRTLRHLIIEVGCPKALQIRRLWPVVCNTSHGWSRSGRYSSGIALPNSHLEETLPSSCRNPMLFSNCRGYRTCLEVCWLTWESLVCRQGEVWSSSCLLSRNLACNWSTYLLVWLRNL